MPDTDRLYALSSTDNNPFRPSESGPGLLINDAVVAMRWYVTSEREENLDVTAHASDDDGATWRLLPVRELLADAERALATAQQAPDRRLGRALKPCTTPWPPRPPTGSTIACATSSRTTPSPTGPRIRPRARGSAAGRSGLSPSVR
ncbi:hypothetical protein [Streptomyces sp. 900105245]